MLKIKEILENYDKYATTLEDRFGIRLCQFLTEEEANQIGFGLSNPKDNWGKPKEWTKENIISQLKEDIEFGIEKAENQRGISSSLMFEVVKSWLKVLEDKEMLEEFADYYSYGLPQLKKAEEKYCKAELEEVGE